MIQSVYILTSERLGFRLFEDTDVSDLERLDMDPDVRAYFPDGIATPEQIGARIARGKLPIEASRCPEFAVIELATGRFVGRAGFGLIEGGDIEVGYVFLKEFWGRGLAQESLRTLLAWAKETLRRATDRCVRSQHTLGVAECHEKSGHAAVQDGQHARCAVRFLSLSAVTAWQLARTRCCFSVTASDRLPSVD